MAGVVRDCIKARVMTVSIIMATYNNGLYLEEAIESVLGQSYQPIELIIVNDGSTDDTKLILESYADRLTSVHTQNRGAASAPETWHFVNHLGNTS